MHGSTTRRRLVASAVLVGETPLVRGRGRVALSLHCTAVKGARCDGGLVLGTTHKSRHGRRMLKLATGTFSLTRASTSSLTLQLSAAGCALLRAHHGRMPAYLVLRESVHGPASVKSSVLLKRARAK